MQICVQNAPFVYNPDTISVGLGFSKGGKWLVEYTVHEKYQSAWCSIRFSATVAILYYITSKSWLLTRHFCFGKNPTTFVDLVVIDDQIRHASAQTRASVHARRLNDLILYHNNLHYFNQALFSFLEPIHIWCSHDTFRSALNRSLWERVLVLRYRQVSYSLTIRHLTEVMSLSQYKHGRKSIHWLWTWANI